LACYPFDLLLLTAFCYVHVAGRTGRFGRKGISINFVHDKKTWLQMEEIEKQLGKPIVRIETNDLDEMEEVSLRFQPAIVPLWFLGTACARTWSLVADYDWSCRK
jgi:hypothetical protein